MTDPATTQSEQKAAPMNWKTFLESQPPDSWVDVEAKLSGPGNSGYQVRMEPIQLHCPDQDCNGTRWFDHVKGDIWVVPTYSDTKILVFRCRHCKRKEKVFAVHFLLESDAKAARAYKIGENPPFGPHTPSRVITLIGPDRELFLKGRRAESRGLGIGAFAYYRRVVENQKSRIIDAMQKVAEKIGAKPDLLAHFEAAKKETQFSKAVDQVKDAIPESLLIDGHNPLTLLHTALSKGLHDEDEDDAKCLELAQSIRVVLTDLAERISLALKEEVELSKAVSRILQKNAKKS